MPQKQKEAAGDMAVMSQGSFLIERHMADAMSAAHWHDHVEINLLLSGRMVYLFNGRQEAVEAGRPVLFWAAIPHRTVAVSGEAPLICIYLPLVDFLGLPIDRALRQSVMQGRMLGEAEIQPSDPILFPQWVEEWQDANAARRQLIIEEVKLRLRRLVLNLSAAKPARPAIAAPLSGMRAGLAVRRAEALADLVNARYAEPLTLGELSKSAGMHQSTATKVFREVFGISVNEYLIRFRLARAMHRLADSEDPILDIAFDCGFGSSSRFYDLFRQRTGTTPKAFRQSFGRSASDAR